MIRKLDRAALHRWVEGLIRAHRVEGVQADGDRFSFRPLQRAGDLRLDYAVAKIAPKKYFQPAAEALLKFDAQGNWESVCDAEPFILLGVHPYDMAAILQMDELFSQKNADTHYAARREQATIVVVDVQRASPNVFAGCMGTATIAKGYDVLLTAVGEDTVLETGSRKGEAICASLQDAPRADAVSLGRREQVWEDNRKYLRKHELKVAPKDLPALLERSVEHPVWEERAARCFSCGSCNTVCPTCYCFDVRDETDWTLKSGARKRFWDGCLLTGFATVSGDHNFRKSRADRYRHRYFRKGLYVPSKLSDGAISCVGCGRCITACVTRIANPVEVYNRLLEVRP